jgi:hypothetical protein
MSSVRNILELEVVIKKIILTEDGNSLDRFLKDK